MTREKFPSISATRLGLLIGVPAALLLLTNPVVLAAVNLKTWNSGDTLNAADLNANFDSLKNEISTAESSTVQTGKSIACSGTASLTNGVGPFSHTFSANECGGTLPDSTFVSAMASWSVTCNGWAMGTALQSADAGYPGYSGYWSSSGCTGTNSATATVVYIKK